MDIKKLVRFGAEERKLLGKSSYTSSYKYEVSKETVAYGMIIRTNLVRFDCGRYL